MSITSAMFTGVSGLLANAEGINVIGNNLANVNTLGFKSGNTVFSDMLSSSIGNNSQIGRGSKVQCVDNVFSQGSFESTTSVTDLALQGNSFFALGKPGGNANVTQDKAFLSRAGSFGVDSTLTLTNPDGYQVLDTQGNPIKFSDNAAVIATAQANLAAAAPATDTNVDTAVTTMQTAAGTLVTNLAAITPAAGPPAVVAASTAETAAATAIKSAADAAATTSAAAKAAPTAPATQASNTAAALAAVNSLYNLVNSYSSTFTTSPNSTTAGATKLFSVLKTANSTFYQSADPVGYAKADLATQNGLAFSKITSIDPSGLITYLGKDGTTTNYYNTSDKVGVAANAANAATVQRLAIMTAANTGGLEKAGGSLFKSTTESGIPSTAFTLASNSANGTSETINTNSLEQSNVDMAAQFVKMILTQRAYSANSKTITTADEMTQEVINLKR